MDSLEQGSLIVVRGFGNSALVRRLWRWDHNGVFVQDEKQYMLRVRGEFFLEPVGFAWSDAFSLPPEADPATVNGTQIDSLSLVPLDQAFRIGQEASA